VLPQRHPVVSHGTGHPEYNFNSGRPGKKNADQLSLDSIKSMELLRAHSGIIIGRRHDDKAFCVPCYLMPFILILKSNWSQGTIKKKSFLIMA
jgi:hypothetical protein